MMNALGVDTSAALSDTHAWNVIRLDDGNCYTVDACWNDSDKSSPQYTNRDFNLGEVEMNQKDGSGTHTYSANLAAWIPAVVKDSYVPTTADTGSGSDTGTDAPTAFTASIFSDVAADAWYADSVNWGV